MRKTNARALITATVLLALIAGPAAAAPGPGEVGSVAADFALPEFPTGTNHTLSEHSGQVVMLFFVGYG